MLKQKLKEYHIILASGSPRRQQFFKDLDIDFSIQLKEVEERYPKELKASEITDFLADLKSKAFTDLKEKDLLITSDTIVWLEDTKGCKRSVLHVEKIVWQKTPSHYFHIYQRQFLSKNY
jgi:predicted house-cleaning NTP pyrophosphatase (Maf/HAM1 superfamily)